MSLHYPESIDEKKLGFSIKKRTRIDSLLDFSEFEVLHEFGTSWPQQGGLLNQRKKNTFYENSGDFKNFKHLKKVPRPVSFF